MKRDLGRDFQKKMTAKEFWVDIEMEERDKEGAFTDEQREELKQEILRLEYLEKLRAFVHKDLEEIFKEV